MYKKKRYKTIVYILLLIPFFELQSLDMLISHGYNVSLYNLILDSFSLMRALISLVLIVLLLSKDKLKKDPLLLGFFAFIACLNISSIINGSFFMNYLIGSISNIGLLLLCKRGMGKSQEDFLDAGTILFGLYSLLGVISIFLFPNGFLHADQKAFAIYFLGSKNTSIFYWVIFLLLLTIRGVRKQRFPISIILFDLLFMFAAIVCESVNSFLVLILLFVLFLILRWPVSLYKLLTFKSLGVLLVIASSFVLIPQLRETLAPIVKAFGRNMDFTGRIVLWKQAVDTFCSSPIAGHGIFLDYVLATKAIVDHAHCYYLDLLAKYGLLGFLSFLFQIVYVWHGFAKKNKSYSKFVSSGLFFVFALLTHSIIDNLPIYQWIYFSSVLFYSSPGLTKKE